MTRLVITDGIILRKRGVGEANTLLYILSARLGLVQASARSSRLAKSKLRYGLEPLTRARFSLVRGKHEWKITGVVGVGRFFGMDALSLHARAALGRVSQMLLRLVHGEEHAPEPFSCVDDGFRFLSTLQTLEAVREAELLLMLRILHRLGYVAETPQLAPLLVDDPLTPNTLAQALPLHSMILRTVNESLNATGL